MIEKKSWLLVVFALFFVVGSEVVMAGIVVNGPDAGNVNVGDEIIISGYSIRDEDTLGLLKFKLNCGGSESVLLIKSVSLKTGIKKDFTEILAITSSAEGSCGVDVELESLGNVLESAQSGTFFITTDVTGSFSLSEEEVQVGESLDVLGRVFKQDGSSLEGFALISLMKDGVVYFSDSSVVSGGNLNYELITKDIPGGEYEVDAEVRDGFGNNFIFDVGKFNLISKISVSAFSDKGHYLPEDNVMVNGVADVLDGKLKSGKVYVDFDDDSGDESMSSWKKYEEDVKNGEFEADFYLDKDVKTGKHDIILSVEDEYGGVGTYEFSIIVDAVPTKIVVVVDKEAVNPGGEIVIKTFLKDQAGDVMEGEIFVLVESGAGEVYFEGIKKSNEQFEVGVDEDLEPGNYFVRVNYGDVEGESAFLVGQVVGLDYALDGQILVIGNVGNVFFEGLAHIRLESESEKRNIVENVGLGLGDVLRIDLGKGTTSGIYTVYVGDEIFEDVEIVYVKKIGYGWLWYVLGIVLIFCLAWLFTKLKKKSKMRKIRSAIQKHPVKRQKVGQGVGQRMERFVGRGKHLKVGEGLKVFGKEKKLGKKSIFDGRRRRRKTVRGRRGEMYGGANLSRIKNDEDHVKKFKDYMGRVVSFGKKPMKFKLRKRAYNIGVGKGDGDVYGYVPVKKGPMVRGGSSSRVGKKGFVRKSLDDGPVKDVFSGVGDGWGSSSVRSFRENVDRRKKKSDKSDDKGDGSSGGLFNMFG